MLNNDQIKKIVENSLQYPSGDNCQQWTFFYSKGKLHIHFSLERADHPLDFGGISSALSLGCLIEAIDISASLISYQTKIEYHPFTRAENQCWASIEFVSATRAADPLSEFIQERATDRRLFDKGDLPVSAIENAVKSITENSQVKIHCLSKISQNFTDYVVNSEELMMNHDEVLPKILQWTRFTKADAERTRDGLSLKNMGVKFWEVPSLKLIKRFPFFLKLMRPEMLRQHRARVRKQITSSAGVVLATIPKGEPHQVPIAGRAIYRAWLELTRQKFGVQPLTFASLLIYGVNEGLLNDKISEKWLNFFKSADGILRTEIDFPSTHSPLWMIRTGRSTPLPKDQRTLRKSVESVLKI